MKPTFLIIGAPKAGTTSLHRYLRENPDVFMSSRKELNFFSPDLHRNVRDWDQEAYLKHFSRASNRHTAIGEASVHYLWSQDAPSRIFQFRPDMKLIVMFRNPVDVAHALHSQMLWNCIEDVSDFECAWRLTGSRRQGKSLPLAVRRDPSQLPFLFYDEIPLQGRHIQKYMKVFPREQIHAIFFDDFAADTQRVYAECLRFLKVSPDARTQFPVSNENKEHASALARRIIQLILFAPRPLRRTVDRVKRACGIRTLGIERRVRSLNGRQARRAPISESFRSALRDYFQEDVSILESTFDRDLSHWT